MDLVIQSELLAAVGGTKIADYDALCKYYTLCNQLIAGVDAEKLIKQFVKRETEDELKQRINITQLINKSVSKNLMDVAYKIPRSNAISKSLTDSDANKSNTAKLTEILNKFYGNKSYNDFINDAFIDKNYIDPNGFIVFEWKAFDANVEKATPYPFIITTEQAVYYSYDNNILQFLVVKQTINKLDTWTYYGMDFAQKLIEIPDEQKKFTITDGQLSKDVNGNDITNIAGRFYIFQHPLPYKLNQVPAFKIGFKKSLGNYNLLESPLDAAFPYLLKGIKTVSEMDLNMACHAFAQKFEYGPACKGKECLNGRLPDNKICPECKGEGVITHTSAQDTIRLKMPKDPNELFNLAELIHYEYPPVDGLKFQDEYIDKLINKCERSIYGTESFSRQDIAMTATEKNLELQSKYDSLYPFALHISDFWEWGINLICKITDITGITPNCTVSKDFKFKTKSDYVQELIDAKNAGASLVVLSAIEDEIIKLDYQDNPQMITRYQNQKYFQPFKNKTENELLSIISALPSDNYYRVLWTYFDEILNAIERENVNFYDLTIDKQQPIVDKKVQEFITKYKVVTPQLPVNNFLPKSNNPALNL